MSEDKTKLPDNWRSISELERALAEKAEYLPVGESLIDYSDDFDGRGDA